MGNNEVIKNEHEVVAMFCWRQAAYPVVRYREAVIGIHLGKGMVTCSKRAADIEQSHIKIGRSTDRMDRDNSWIEREAGLARPLL